MDWMEWKLRDARRAAERVGREKGEAEGSAEGSSAARNALAEPFDALAPQGRLDDYAKALRDPAYCDKLCEELGLAVPPAA